MKRRAFISVLGSAAVWPLVARAQHKPARIALLMSGAPGSSRNLVEAFKQGMLSRGLVEERDYVLDERWAEGLYERFPALASELVKRNPNIIVVHTITAARAAQLASNTIPIIVVAINNPVGVGLIASLARPGGNITGLATLMEDVIAKVFELMRLVMPKAKRIAILFNPANPSSHMMLKDARKWAGASGLILLPLEFKTPGELDATFEPLAIRKADALLIINDAALLDSRERIAALSMRYRLPSFSGYPEYPDSGGLLGYGPSRLDMWRRSSNYVKRILDGAEPSDLPVEQPTTIELVINLNTAKALKLNIHQSMLLRADRVIE